MKITCHEAETSSHKVLLNTRVLSVTVLFRELFYLIWLIIYGVEFLNSLNHAWNHNYVRI